MLDYCKLKIVIFEGISLYPAIFIQAQNFFQFNEFVTLIVKPPENRSQGVLVWARFDLDFILREFDTPLLLPFLS